ncbi:hypothetical protein [Sphingomonas mollis]|uniref:Uncharacterized protein n=1 Tax=Sphingomonas mollis TaxID=2795726 RepID=A0ABS0XKN4_9SPHN|nr:hypothetical protein [Sphingomonas sp. BT553]MBJ6120589.1 hypothetical protein [Sphingomonas sp. BT553]
MLFPTKEKVEREVDALLTRFERIEQRADFNVNESSKFASVLGPNEIAEKILRNARSIIENLHEAGAQARFGLRPIRAIANDLPAVAKVASEYSGILDNMDFTRKSGQVN